MAWQSGYLSREMFPDKFESPTLHADPDALDQHNRTSMLDFRPERILFEHEQPRNSHESETKITLWTNGSRSQWDPDHLDLNLAEQERDPRGQSTMPDFYKYIDENRVRMGYYSKNFTDDSPTGESSGVIEPQDLNNRKRATRDDFKDFYKNFIDSYETYIPAGKYDSIRLMKGPGAQVLTEAEVALGYTPSSYERSPDPQVLFSNTFETRHEMQTDNLLPTVYQGSAPRTMADVADATARHLIAVDDSPPALLDMVVRATKFPTQNPYSLATTMRMVEYEGSSVAPENIANKELTNALQKLKITPRDASTLVGLIDLTTTDSRFKNSVETYTQFKGRPKRDDILKYVAELTAKEPASVQLEMKSNLRQIIRSSPSASASQKRLMMNDSILGTNPFFVSYMTAASKGKLPQRVDRRLTKEEMKTAPTRSTQVRGRVEKTNGKEHGVQTHKNQTESRKVVNYAKTYNIRGKGESLTTGNVTESANMRNKIGTLPERTMLHDKMEDEADRSEFGHMNRFRSGKDHKRHYGYEQQDVLEMG